MKIVLDIVLDSILTKAFISCALLSQYTTAGAY